MYSRSTSRTRIVITREIFNSDMHFTTSLKPTAICYTHLCIGVEICIIWSRNNIITVR